MAIFLLEASPQQAQKQQDTLDDGDVAPILVMLEGREGTS